MNTQFWTSLAGAGILLAAAAGEAAGQSVQSFGSRPRQVAYVAINVADFDRSADFYSRVIGIKLLPDSHRDSKTKKAASFSFGAGLEDTFLTIESDSSKPPPTVKGGNLARLAFKVEDLRATLVRAQEAGRRVVVQPFDVRQVPGLRAAVIEDPDGNPVEVFQMGGG